MYTLVIIIHVLVCLILIAAILLQSGRGGGLSDLFGAGTTQTIFGTRASTFMTRATTFAAIAFLLTCISLTVLSSRRFRSLMEGVKEAPVVAPPQTSSPAQEIPEETQPEEVQAERWEGSEQVQDKRQ